LSQPAGLIGCFSLFPPRLRPTFLEQVKILDLWLAKYAEWRGEGIFFKRYRESWSGSFTWEQERRDAEEELGRLIPRSHWWFWPSDMQK
jgi:hypothetical protein